VLYPLLSTCQGVGVWKSDESFGELPHISSSAELLSLSLSLSLNIALTWLFQSMPQDHSRNAQPGLEVYDSTLRGDAYPTHIQYYDHGKENAPTSTGTPTVYYPPHMNGQGHSEFGTEAPPESRRWKWWALAAAVFAVLAIVIGAVLGVLLTNANKQNNSAAEKSGDAGNSGGTTDRPSNVTNNAATSIRPNSPLSVSGYRFGTDYSLQLMFQGPDDRMWTSFYQTNFGIWAAPRALNAIGISDTPMASGVILLSNLDAVR
jgi:hypothetical protein